MSSYDKVVKLACKPKPAPPKAKYIDTIITATYSEDGAIHDVCKALAPKFREPNVVIVFKALIVLHTMIRSGATDNVLSHLSQSDVLRLRNVGNEQWEGYTPPKNLTNYAYYLDYRIRAYRDLKHDPIRVQSENNRDLLSQEESSSAGGISGFGNATPASAGSLAGRRQTIVGRKLKIMTVEKGLLRETRIVQKMIDALLECKFYLDDLEDQLIITALRDLVKDLLVLSQACNEGVANVLEHYFEMSHVDATTALALYRHFCSQAEKVSDYLAIAKKLQNLLNVPIPEMNRAPVSLAASLEEYLNDPNFEQNRIEYKTNKESAERNAKEKRTAGRRKQESKKEEKPPVPQAPKPEVKASTSTSSPPIKATKPTGPKPDVDAFFASIEEPQNGQPNQANGPFAQPGQFNPFAAQLAAMQTGAPSAFIGANGASPFVTAQPTGFPSTNPFPTINVQPQATGFPGAAPFQSQSAFLAPFQPTGQSPFARPASAAPNIGGGAGSSAGLQPLVAQATGANPFRQSFLPTQPTGLPFVTAQPTGVTPPFLQPAPTGSPFANTTPTQSPNPFPFAGSNGLTSTSPFAMNNANSNSPFATANSNSPFAASTTTGTSAQKITPPFARPQSTPITGNAGSPPRVVSHETGSRNPFGRPKSPPPPPVPKLPTLGQLAAGGFGATSSGINGSNSPSPFNANGTNGLTTAPSTAFGGGLGAGLFGSGTAGTTASALQPQKTGVTPFSISSVASEFAFSKPSSPPPSGATNPTTSNGSNLFGSSAFSLNPLSSQDTATSGTTNNTNANTFSSFTSNFTGSSSTTAPSSTSFLKPQPTGLGGSSIKPFKPSSSFGATLLESLPTIPQGSTLSTPTTSSATSPGPQQPNGNAAFTTPATTSLGTPGGALNAQPTGLGPFSALGSSSGSAFGSTLGSGGLQPQVTGNPFRLSTLGGLGTSGTGSTGGLGSAPSLGSGVTTNPTGFGSSLFAQKTGAFPNFGGSAGGQPGPAFSAFAPQQQQQPQHTQQQGSLI